MAGQQPLRRLGLDDDLVSRLASEGLHTAGDMFSKTELQLVQSLDASREKIVELLDYVSRRIVPEQAKTAGDILRERREAGASFFVATGIRPLDDALQVRRLDQHHRVPLCVALPVSSCQQTLLILGLDCCSLSPGGYVLYQDALRLLFGVLGDRVPPPYPSRDVLL